MIKSTLSIWLTYFMSLFNILVPTAKRLENLLYDSFVRWNMGRVKISSAGLGCRVFYFFIKVTWGFDVAEVVVEVAFEREGLGRGQPKANIGVCGCLL